MRPSVTWLSLLGSLLLPGTALFAQETPNNRGQVCWPLHFAGVTLGVTTDSQVQRLLGKGILDTKEGDRARYYIDVKQTATLHIVAYTDAVVGKVSVTLGVDPLISKAERLKATSKFFDPREGFGKWHALRLGSSKREVLKNLGEPEKRTTPEEWVYSSSCACELPESFTVFFTDDRLSKVVFSALPG